MSADDPTVPETAEATEADDQPIVEARPDEPVPPGGVPTATVLAVGATTAISRRLAASGVSVTDDPNVAEAVVRCTATPDADVPSGAPALQIVLTHRGGQAVALRWLGEGAHTLVSEGGEAAIADIVLAARTPDHDGEATGVEARDEPCIVVLRSPELGAAGGPVTSLVARRLHSRWQTVLARTTAQTIDASRPGTLVLAWPSRDVDHARSLVILLAAAAEGLLPDGFGPVRVGAGLALPDDAQTEAARRDAATSAAERALTSGRALLTVSEHLEATASESGRAVLRTAVSTVENARSLPSHGRDVADLAVALGRRLGLSSDVLEDVRVAATHHHLGLLGTTDAAICDDDSRSRSAQVLLPHGGESAAALLRSPRTSAAAWVVTLSDVVELSQRQGAQATDVLDAIRKAHDDAPEELLEAFADLLAVDAFQATSA